MVLLKMDRPYRCKDYPLWQSKAVYAKNKIIGVSTKCLLGARNYNNCPMLPMRIIQTRKNRRKKK